MPAILLLTSLVCAFWLALGLRSEVVWLRGGFSFQLLTYRLEWVLLGLSLITMIAFAGWILARRRSLLWFSGLLVVVGALVFHYGLDPVQRTSVWEYPSWAPAEQAQSMKDDDWVVGLQLPDKQAYALPFRQLFSTPVVMVTSHDQRALVLWSPYANRASVWSVERAFKVRDLSVVSMPYNTLLLHNRRYGQFISGVSGLTLDFKVPHGFGRPMPSTKTTWGQWKARFPQTLVLPLASTGAPAEASKPLPPKFTFGPRIGPEAPEKMVWIDGDVPAAIRFASLLPDASSRKSVHNIQVGKQSLLLFRHPQTQQIHLFDRSVEGHPTPLVFVPAPGVQLKDTLTGTLWDTQGVAKSGALAQKKVHLSPVECDMSLDMRIMRLWYPEVGLRNAEELKGAQ